MKYEEKIQARLADRYGEWYLPSPWIEYQAGKFIGVCQPDGLLFQPERGVITIVEIKFSHSVRAWFQIWKLYKLVLERIFPEELWEFRGLEICRWFHSGNAYPGPVEIIGEATDAKPPRTTSVLIWDARRTKPLSPRAKLRN